MTPDELRRIVGPAKRLLFEPIGKWALPQGVLEVVHDAEQLPRKAGPLRLSSETAARITESYTRAWDARISAFVETAAPDFVNTLEDAEYRALLGVARESGRDIGLTTERAFGFWALLSVMSGGSIVNDRRFREAVSSDAAGPDLAVEQLVNDISLLPPDAIEGML